MINDDKNGFYAMSYVYDCFRGYGKSFRLIDHVKNLPDKQRLNFYDEAIKECNKAIELDPNLATAYAIRSVAYGSKGQYDKALADCNKAIELAPNPNPATNGSTAIIVIPKIVV